MRAEPLSAPTLQIVLVHPEIHWNTGNVGRTCLAVGAALHLIEPLGFSLSDRHVRRAGLDYWPRVRPTVWRDWESFEPAMAAPDGVFLFSAEAACDYVSVAYPGPATLVFGRESTGLPAELRARYSDRLVRIPMHDPELRSLNLSTAVAVAAYEVLRQWRATGRGDPAAEVKQDGTR